MRKILIPLSLLCVIFGVLLPFQSLSGTTRMRVTRLGTSPVLPFAYREASMQGDTLAFYNYSVSGNTITLTRAFVTPESAVVPMQAIHTWNLPSEWGTLSAYPRCFSIKNGKLYSAFVTSDKLLVMFTDAHGTTRKVIDTTGITVESLYIKDETIGYFSSGSYPAQQPVRIYEMDFAAQSSSVFYEGAVGYSAGYEFNELHDGYMLIRSNYSQYPDLLVHNGQIVHTYPQHWIPDYYFLVGYSMGITESYSYMALNDGLDRSSSWHVLAWVEDNQLYSTLIPGAPSPSFYAYFSSIIPHDANTFSCIHGLGYNYFRDPLDGPEFTHWQAINGQLQQINMFPDLSAYNGAMHWKRMDASYDVALHKDGDNPYTFLLVDHTDASVRAYPFAINTQLYSMFTSERYLHLRGADNRIYTFVLELYTANPDEDAPALIPVLEASPNPFRSVCRVTLRADKQQSAKLEVYNLRGQRVATLHDGALAAGTREFTWNGSSHPAGIYFLKLSTRDASTSRRIILIK